MQVPFEVTPEPTPNPNSVKFTLSLSVSPGKSKNFPNRESAQADPLAKHLFEIPGVTIVFMLNNFISVQKEPAADWQEIGPKVEAMIRDHFTKAPSS